MVSRVVTIALLAALAVLVSAEQGWAQTPARCKGGQQRGQTSGTGVVGSGTGRGLGGTGLGGGTPTDGGFGGAGGGPQQQSVMQQYALQQQYLYLLTLQQQYLIVQGLQQLQQQNAPAQAKVPGR